MVEGTGAQGRKHELRMKRRLQIEGKCVEERPTSAAAFSLWDSADFRSEHRGGQTARPRAPTGPRGWGGTNEGQTAGSEDSRDQEPRDHPTDMNPRFCMQFSSRDFLSHQWHLGGLRH